MTATPSLLEKDPGQELQARLIDRHEFHLKRSRFTQRFLLVLASALLGLLSAVRIGRSSLTYDESFAVGLAQTPWRSALRVMAAREPGSLIWDLLLRPWISLFGDGPTAVRSLSALFAVATVPVTFRTAQRLVGPVASGAASLLVGTSAAVAANGRAGDGAALTVFLTAAAMLLLAAASESGHRRTWCAFAAAALAATYGQVYAFPVILAGVLVSAVTRPLARKGLCWALSALMAGLTPLIVFIASGRAAYSGWVAAAASQFYLFPRSVSWLTGQGSGWYEAAVILGLAVSILSWLRRSVLQGGRGLPAGVGLALAWSTVPLVCGSLLSQVSPLLAPQFLTVSVPGVAILLAAALTSIPRRSLAAALTAVSVVTALIVAFGLPTAPGTQDWRGVVSALGQRASRGDAVLIEPAYDIVPLSYAVRQTGRAQLFPSPLSTRGSWSARSSIAGQRPCDVIPQRGTVWVISTQDSPGRAGLALAARSMPNRRAVLSVRVRGLTLSAFDLRRVIGQSRSSRPTCT